MLAHTSGILIDRRYVPKREVHKPAMRNQESITFELCAQTLPACLAASAGGAHRIELCSSLEVGGLTPPLSLVEAAVRLSAIPVHVLLRPFADNFRTSPPVVAELASSLQAVRSLGAAGVVFGLLLEDGKVDIDRMRSFVQLAAPLPVTFHRAFDATPDLFEALEDVISTGCARVLTSGGAPDVLAGAPTLARLVRQAGARIDVAIGGGLRLDNAETVVHLTGGRHFHGSLRQGPIEAPPQAVPSLQDIQQMVQVLSSSALMRRTDAASISL
jgi:copper homeostasis protein